MKFSVWYSLGFTGYQGETGKLKSLYFNSFIPYSLKDSTVLPCTGNAFQGGNFRALWWKIQPLLSPTNNPCCKGRLAVPHLLHQIRISHCQDWEEPDLRFLKVKPPPVSPQKGHNSEHSPLHPPSPNPFFSPGQRPCFWTQLWKRCYELCHSAGLLPLIKSVTCQKAHETWSSKAQSPPWEEEKSVQGTQRSRQRSETFS